MGDLFGLKLNDQYRGVVDLWRWSVREVLQVGIRWMATSVNVGGVVVITLAQNAKDVCSIAARGTIFPIFITLTTLVDHGPIQGTCCTVADPTLCISK